MYTFAAFCTGLLLPSSDTGRVATRRAMLQGATAAAMLPLLSTSPEAAVADQFEERPGFGGTGALRSDMGPSVLGDGVEILITDMSYKELDKCPPNFFIPEKEGPWDCLEITATALNQGKRKKVKAADVFGQMYDREGFSVLSTALDPTQKTPMTALLTDFPQGVKKQVSWTVVVQARSPRPFRFAGFKGAYRNAAVAKTFQKFDPCEVDSSKCDDFLDQPDNAKALREGKGNNYRE